MKVDKAILSKVLYAGAILFAVMLVALPQGKMEYWNYVDLVGIALGLFAGFSLWGSKDMTANCLAITNWVGAAALALGHFNYFHLGMSAQYAAYHVWGPIDGFLIAVWFLTGCYLKK